MEAKGDINAYVCEKCGKRTVTINGDDGVTAFLIQCRADGVLTECPGMAQSQFYSGTDGLVPEWEWYRPDDPANFFPDWPAMQDHLWRGGMMLRLLTAARRMELLGKVQ